MGRFLISSENLVFDFLPSGDLFEIRHGDLLLNQLQGNGRDGSLNNLFLRIWQGGEPQVYPLLGVKSQSKVSYGKSRFRSAGQAGGLTYTVDFYVTEPNLWFWDVRIAGAGGEVDLVYGQDLGLARRGALLNNEAYISQYLDHSVFSDDQGGFVLCSRQNQFQGGHPYLQQGGLTKVISYSTDGFQFFGLDYKETNRPAALYRGDLGKEIYQYEMAYAALQTERVVLRDGARFIFYGLFVPDHPQAVQKPIGRGEIEAAWQRIVSGKEEKLEPAAERLQKSREKLLACLDWTMAEINTIFPQRQHEEWREGTFLSFFTPTHEHVVLKAKELLVERPHGHILVSGGNDQMADTISTNCYMFGIFNAQLAVGNTSFNRFLSRNRTDLNLFKVSGQRLSVEIDGEWQFFALPSAFEMGFNYARWYYKAAEETFAVTTYVLADSLEVRFEVKSRSGKPYRYRLSLQVIMDEHEYNGPYHWELEGRTLLFRAGPQALNGKIVPDLAYALHVSDKFSLWEEQETSLLILDMAAVSKVEVAIKGQLTAEQGIEEFRPEPKDFQQEVAKYRVFLRKLMANFALQHPGSEREKMARLNTVARWFSHNMLVHFSAPRGLEQPTGGGWGTRDVCQGPAEYFLASGNHKAVREILLAVYSRQQWEDGDWPQWFMFDRFYFRLQAEGSHGDVLLWPLKLLGDYLRASGDQNILEAEIPYFQVQSGEYSAKTYSFRHHLDRQLARLQEGFLANTSLSAYGDGDWNDTLQPANAEMRRYLVSSWTVALTYQVLNQLSQVLQGPSVNKLQKKLEHLAAAVRLDFERYLLAADVIPGFIDLEDRKNPQYLLHPSDDKTGIHYRLLPLTRSIIGELADDNEAAKNIQLIEEHLLFPDGVRLMDRPASYQGGVSEHFQRAEQAANFGREVGLQYVHAHIRLIEALAKLGRAEQAWHSLQVVNPIGLKKVVPNAELRQSNAYFSSSDGKFNHRYEAAAEFWRLKEGKVGVKGGWRIYSSGPGIYFHQLVCNCLGLRQQWDALEIDPVLPRRLHDLRLTYEIWQKPVQFIFNGQARKREVKVNEETILWEELSNPYRKGGFRICRTNLERLLQPQGNVIEVFW